MMPPTTPPPPKTEPWWQTWPQVAQGVPDWVSTRAAPAMPTWTQNSSLAPGIAGAASPSVLFSPDPVVFNSPNIHGCPQEAPVWPTCTQNSWPSPGTLGSEVALSWEVAEAKLAGWPQVAPASPRCTQKSPSGATASTAPVAASSAARAHGRSKVWPECPKVAPPAPTCSQNPSAGLIVSNVWMFKVSDELSASASFRIQAWFQVSPAWFQSSSSLAAIKFKSLSASRETS